MAGVTFDPAAVLTADARTIIDSLTVTATPNPITGSVMIAIESERVELSLSAVNATLTAELIASFRTRFKSGTSSCEAASAEG